MELSKLPRITDKKNKRLGRGAGSGRGAKSGRGTTRHQAARTDIPLHFEGGQAKITKKYPLLRGKERNKSVRQKPLAVGLDFLNKFKDGETVDISHLVKKGLIEKKNIKIGIKILASGKLEKKLIVKLKTSDSARAKIEKLGGRVESQ